MDNLFKNADIEKILKTLIQIYAEQEGIILENIIIEKIKEDNNGRN